MRSLRSPALLVCVVALVLAAASAPATAQVDARMFRQPDVSATQIAFVYAGDIWVAPKSGGTAHRLSTPEGEERFPRFSPDGSTLAFTANYDGNEDVYRVPAGGGEAVRLTQHPQDDRTLGWHPDGSRVLVASARHSERQRYRKFFTVPRDGGLARPLPVPYGEFGALSPDGTWIAYTPKSRSERTWKRYRGGWAPDVWLFNLETLESRRVTEDPANDDHPMWHGRTLYFLSDRGPAQRYNLWAYEMDGGEMRQVTDFTDVDVHYPSIGPDEIVFQAGGRLYLLGLEDEQVRPVDVDVVTDRSTLRPRTERVGDEIRAAAISPSGQRALFQARGEVFTVPAEHGPVRNLTRSSGTAERTPAWSPDGERVAYWTDRDGEYQLALRSADGSGPERILTSFESGFRYRPHWSPDGRRLAYVDQAMRIQLLEVETGEVTTVDRGLWMTHGALASFRPSWSPDGRWLAWSRGQENRNGSVYLHDTESGETHRVTSAFYHDRSPAFGPEGDHLFFLTDRHFSPVYSDHGNSWAYPNATRVAVATLRPDVASPLAPRNDVEAGDGAEDADGEDGHDEEGDGSDAPVEIDLDGLEARAEELPLPAGNYTHLEAVEGKVLVHRRPRSGSAEEASPLVYWDLEEREEKTILDDVDAYHVSRDGGKLLVRAKGEFHIVEPGPGQELASPLRTSEMATTVRPEREWRQIFSDTWRFYRDYFYDPNMHGVDWEAMRDQYRDLLDDAVTRWDVNHVLGEMIAELDASHTYRSGGDVERAETRSAGMLGVDWEVAEGAYRIGRILRPAPWVSEVRSPLDRPGLDVDEGTYVLAVNGTPLETDAEPWAVLEGHAGETVELTIGDRPDPEEARQVLVETLRPGEAARLRHLAWIQQNRETVAEATDGRVGYVYVPNTGIGGQNELVRQFQGQLHMDGLVIDERWNSGGQIPDRFVELLNRPPLSWWAVRDGRDWPWPPAAHFGPQVMLINGWSGSGGDAFPYYFREVERGPLIGERTWGGLIGISGVPSLVDGGAVTVPTFRMYGPDGEWFAEGHGVEPDIRVEDDPSALARGTDPQLQRAIRWTLEQLEEDPPPKPARPSYEDRSRPEPDSAGGGSGG